MAVTADLMSGFRLEEYKALRSEILYQIQNIDQIKFWIAAAMAAYYSFIAAKLLSLKEDQVVLSGPIWVWAVPIILPPLGYFRLISHVAQLTIFADYIKQIEDLNPSLAGWEHYYGAHRSEDYVWYYDKSYFAILLIFAVMVLFVRWKVREK